MAQAAGVWDPCATLARYADLIVLQDDASALDVPTMRRWNLILRVFMAEYLNLQPSASTREESEDVPRIQRSPTELVSLGLIAGDEADAASVACIIAVFHMSLIAEGCCRSFTKCICILGHRIWVRTML